MRLCLCHERIYRMFYKKLTPFLVQVRYLSVDIAVTVVETEIVRGKDFISDESAVYDGPLD